MLGNILLLQLFRGLQETGFLLNIQIIADFLIKDGWSILKKFVLFNFLLLYLIFFLKFDLGL